MGISRNKMDRYWKNCESLITPMIVTHPSGEDHKNGVGIILRNEAGKIYDWVLANIR